MISLCVLLRPAVSHASQLLLNRTHFSQSEALGETASTWQVAPNRHQAEAKAANEIPKPEAKEATEAESPEAEASQRVFLNHMNYSLGSLNGGDMGDYIGDYYRGYEY